MISALIRGIPGQFSALRLQQLFGQEPPATWRSLRQALQVSFGILKFPQAFSNYNRLLSKILVVNSGSNIAIDKTINLIHNAYS